MWIKFRSCKTRTGSAEVVGCARGERTRNTGEELPGKALDLTVRKWHKCVAFQEVKNALPKKVHDYTDVASVVKAITKMYASVSVFVVVCFEGRKDPQLYSRSISVLLHGSDDLDGDKLVSLLIMGLNDLTKGPLAKKFRYLVWDHVSYQTVSSLEDLRRTSLCQVGVRYHNVVAILVINLAVLVV